MSFESNQVQLNSPGLVTRDIAISVSNLAKCYHMYAQPRDRIRQALSDFFGGKKNQLYKEFWSLKDVSFEVKKGETLGVIGRNGAGKSTLLQMLCGTLTPTSGSIKSYGRVAALLELGAGFNQDFSGRENIYMNAAVLGLTDQEIANRIDEIISFADIGLFIDQPVKTYSSGMFVRLAFSIATSVDPDILIIDEALSVGDGAFSRKSFDRIMKMRDSGKTILFCSHSLYQVEAICDRVIWLESGKIQEIGDPAKCIVAYNAMLSRSSNISPDNSDRLVDLTITKAPAGVAYIKSVVVTSDGMSSKELRVLSRKSFVQIQLDFISDVSLKPPSVAVVITDVDGREIASSGTSNDGLVLEISSSGVGSAILSFEKFPLLKGVYWVNVLLMCERGIHIYEPAEKVAKLIVEQSDLEVGVVSLPHLWSDGGRLL